MLKSFLPFSAVLFFAFTPTLSQGARPQDATPAPASAPNATNPVKPTAESQAKAKSLYSIDCSMCHADNGNGQSDVAKGMGLTMPDFTNAKTLSTLQDSQLFEIIRNGKDKMPPEAAGRANDTMVWNLIIYMRGMSKPQSAGK